MDAAKSSLRSRNLDLNQVYNPKSRAKIYFRSILWGQNPFPIRKVGLKSISDPESRAKIHFRSILWGQNPFFDLKCPVLIRKIDLLSRLWFKSLRLVSIYLRFLKIVCVWFILCPYETRWLLKGYRCVTERLPKGCCLGCKLLHY